MKSIYRTTKDRNNPYVMINKMAITNPKLSMKAKGLFAYFMTLPDDWEVYQKELVKHFTDGKASVAAAILELQNAGYVKKEKIRGKDGKWTGWAFQIFETPPRSDYPISENPTSDNRTLPSIDLVLSTDPTNSPPSQVKAPQTAHKQITERYFALYQDRFSMKPAFNGKEGRAIKNLLSHYEPQEILVNLDKYFASDDTFYAKQGYTLQYFQTAINALRIQGKDHRPSEFVNSGDDYEAEAARLNSMRKQ